MNPLGHGKNAVNVVRLGGALRLDVCQAVTAAKGYLTVAGHHDVGAVIIAPGDVLANGLVEDLQEMPAQAGYLGDCGCGHLCGSVLHRVAPFEN